MYNKTDLDYLTGTIMIQRDSMWHEVETNVVSKSYVRDAINEVMESLEHRIECLEEMVCKTQADLYQTRNDLYQMQNDRTLIAETNGSRLYIDGPGVRNLPTDLEDVTLIELLEIISI